MIYFITNIFYIVSFSVPSSIYIFIFSLLPPVRYNNHTKESFGYMYNSESWRGIVRFIVILTALSLALITLWIKRNGGILLSNDDEIDQENEYETVSLNDSTS